jgi:hypothetical protein
MVRREKLPDPRVSSRLRRISSAGSLRVDRESSETDAAGGCWPGCCRAPIPPPAAVLSPLPPNVLPHLELARFHQDCAADRQWLWALLHSGRQTCNRGERALLRTLHQRKSGAFRIGSVRKHGAGARRRCAPCASAKRPPPSDSSCINRNG